MSKAGTIMTSQFWEWFDRKRHDADLSDRGVAYKADIANSVISKARNNERPIGFEALVKIAQAFDEDPEYVLRIAGLLPKKKNVEDERLEEIARRAAKLSDDTLDQLERFVDFLEQGERAQGKSETSKKTKTSSNSNR